MDNATAAAAEILPSLGLVECIARAIWDKKGFEVVALRVREVVQYTDYMVICSATSDRHAVAIADSIEEVVRRELGQKTIGVEGRGQGRWVLLDFSDVVVHVFHRPVRDYYEIERLFADAPRVPLIEPEWVKEISPDQLIEQADDYGEALWSSAEADPDAEWTEEWDDDGEPLAAKDQSADKNVENSERSHARPTEPAESDRDEP